MEKPAHRMSHCAEAHLGPTFTDERFHDTGVAWQDGELCDQGRYIVTGKEEDRGGNPDPYLDSELRPPKLTSEEKQALITFLHAVAATTRRLHVHFRRTMSAGSRPALSRPEIKSARS